MGQLKISGSLIAGPPGSVSAPLPAMVATAPLSTKTDPKGYERATGILQRSETWAAFTDTGEPGNVVKRGHFLYFKSDGPVQLRLTTDDGLGGNVLAVIPVDGIYLSEIDEARYLKKLEVHTGAALVQFEYFVSGQS